MLSKMLGVRIFDLEAHGGCNLICPFCPRDRLPPAGAMSLNTFSKFLEHVPLGTRDVLSFIGVGEPTLNRELPEFIRMAKRRCPGVHTWITTNGTMLNQKVLPPLLDAGLNTLDISSNGLEKEEYERLMKGAHFDKFLANLAYALTEVAKRGERTRLQVNYIVSRENAGQEQRIQAYWRARGVRYFRTQWMQDRSGLVRVTGMTPPDTPGLRCATCMKFEIMPVITWTGDVLYCSHDIPRTHPLGNIREHTWEEIARRKRTIVREGDWPVMCGACTDPQRHDMRQKVDEMLLSHLRHQVEGRVRGAWAVVTAMGLETKKEMGI